MGGGGQIFVGPLENNMEMQREVSLECYHSQVKRCHQGLGDPLLAFGFLGVHHLLGIRC